MIPGLEITDYMKMVEMAPADIELLGDVLCPTIQKKAQKIIVVMYGQVAGLLAPYVDVPSPNVAVASPPVEVSEVEPINYARELVLQGAQLKPEATETIEEKEERLLLELSGLAKFTKQKNIFDVLTLGKIFINYPTGPYELSYNKPAEFLMDHSSSNPWSTSTNSIFDTVEEIVNILVEGGPCKPDLLVASRTAHQYMARNVEMQNYWVRYFGGERSVANINEATRRRALAGSELNEAQVQQVLGSKYDIKGYRCYDEGWLERVFLTTAAASGSATLVISSGNNIENADRVRIKHATALTSEVRTVSAGGGTTSLTLSAVLTNSYPIGSMIEIRKPFMRKNYVLLKGRLPSGRPDMNFIITPNQPSNWTEAEEFALLIKDERDPLRHKHTLTAGFSGLVSSMRDNAVSCKVA